MQGSISRDNAKIRLTSGIPRRSEGSDGDIVITRVNKYVRMYCKFKSNWHQVGSNFSLKNNSSIKSSFIKNPSIQGNLMLNNFRINKDGDNRKGIRFLEVAKNPKAIQTEFDGGQFDMSTTSDIAFKFKSTLTHATSAVGSDIFDLISGDITAKSVAGWNEVRLLHLAEKTVAGVTGKEFAFYTKENSVVTHSVLQMNFDSAGYMQLKVADDGVTVIETTDTSGTSANLTLHPDGDLKLTPETGIMYLYDQDNNADYAKFTVGTHGDLTLETVDAAAAAAHLTLNVDGDVILDPNSGITKFYLAGDTDDLCTLTVAANGATTIATADSDGEVGHLTLDPDGDLIITTDHNTGQVTIDKNSTNTSTATNTAMQIDFDHTGISASGQTITNIGLDLDINCESVTHVGTVSQTGIDIDLVAATAGLQANVGIDIDVDGADNNTGLLINTAGTHMKLVANADVNDYATFTLADTGDLTIATVGSGTTDSDITLDADGKIILDSADRIVAIGATDTFHFDGGTHTYISESSDDVLDFYVGTDKMLSLDEANDKISLAATNWVAGTVSGATVTEFSAANSAYAGMVLGYTRLQGDESTQGVFEIQNSLTVEDSTHQITFKTPPSENVEIQCTFVINAVSTDTRIAVGLSDNATYNSVGLMFEYDSTGISFGDDEVDDGVRTVVFVLGADELASVGSSNTFYIGFSTAGVTKTAYLQYGARATHGICDHPFVIKATALPATIYDGL